MNLKRTSLIPLTAVLFLSGFATLVFEVVWVRMFMPAFGTSTYSISAILVAFMAGIAIGNALVGALADRLKRPLVLLAIIHVAAAVYALLIPWLIPIGEDAYVWAARLTQAPAATRGLIRFLIVLPVLLPVTTMLGGALPLACGKAVSDHLPIRSTGILYAAGVLGGAVGACLAGFYLMGLVGLRNTNALAAVACLFAAASAQLASWLAQERTSKAPTNPSSQAPIRSLEPIQSRFGTVAVTTLAIASGLTCMVYEISFARMLSIALGNESYSFAFTLVSFLLGLAIGGAAFQLLAPHVRSMSVLVASSQLLATAAVALALHLVNHFQDIRTIVEPSLLHPSSGYLFHYVIPAAVVVIMPPVFLGMLLPGALAMALGCSSRPATRAGRLCAVNSIGSILGSFACGFILIPAIGVRNAVLSACAINLLSAGMLYSLTRAKFLPLKLALIVTAIVAMLLAPSIITLDKHTRDAELVYYSEDIGGTVAVFQERSRPVKQMAIDGRKQVPTDVDAMRSFKLQAHIPLLYHPDPKSVMLVSFGGGIAAGAVAQHPVEHIDCAEICAGVPRAARMHFSKENRAVQDDPRLKIYIEDGRNFLLVTTNRYDVISADASHATCVDAWVLYTDEFYVLCRDHLAPGGFMAQWVPMHGLSEYEFASIARTFVKTFPNSSLWIAAIDDEVGHAMLLGSLTETHPTVAELQRAIDQRRIEPDLAQVRLFNAGQLLGTQVLAGKALRLYACNAQLNTDNSSVVAFSKEPYRLHADVAKSYPFLRRAAALEQKRKTAAVRN